MKIRPPLVHCLVILVTALLALESPAQQRRLRNGPWAKDKVPEGWVLHHTKNYQIQSQCGIEKAKRLGVHMEVMNKVYRRMFNPGKPNTKRYAIKLFKDRKSFVKPPQPKYGAT